MAQKQKKYNLDIDEEKDIFLSSLNKKIRNNRKKLEQIDELSKRDKTTLKAEQLEKINSKAEVKENIKYIDTIKGMYYEALKTAKDEGKALPAPVEGRKTEEEEGAQPKTQDEPVIQRVERVEESEEERAARAAKITHQNLSKVINLVNFAQFFRNPNNAQELRHAFESVPDLESFYEFYAKIFTFSESDSYERLHEKTRKALHELESYINGSENPALRNKSYSYLQKIVETTCAHSDFQNHNAEVGVQARQVIETSAIGSIGSELRKGHEHQERVEAPVEQVKASPAKTPLKEKQQISPEKEVRAEQRPQETTKGWEHVEDEESEGSEEERVEEEEQQGGEEQKKNPDDEWNTVKSKLKEKKEEAPRGGNRPYRGGRGGGYRKPRPEGEGGYRRPRTEQGGEENKNENGGEQQQRGERRPYRGGQQGGEYRPYRGNREGGEGGNRGYQGEGGNRGYQGEGGNRGYQGEGGNRGYQGEGGNRGYQGGYRGGYRGGKRSDRPAEEYVKKETATPAPEQKS